MGINISSASIVSNFGKNGYSRNQNLVGISALDHLTLGGRMNNITAGILIVGAFIVGAGAGYFSNIDDDTKDFYKYDCICTGDGGGQTPKWTPAECQHLHINVFNGEANSCTKVNVD